MKPVHSEVCGFFREKGTQFLRRDVAALMVRDVFQCHEGPQMKKPSETKGKLICIHKHENVFFFII